MQIQSELGVIDIIDCRYNGVFQENTSYNENSFTYNYPQYNTIIYSYSTDNILGDIALSNGLGALRVERSGIYVQISFVDIVNNIVYPLAESDNYSQPRCTTLYACTDNDGKVLLFSQSISESLTWAITELVRPTENHLGTAQIIAKSFSGHGRVYRSAIDSILKSLPPSDPYNPGGETETGGGEGDFDNTSDPIPEASLPTLSAVDAKFISLYTPTLAELQSLANYMWSPLFDIDTLKKLFADPMKVILGLSIVPFAVPSSGQQAITIGNIPTGVNMTKASTQYVQIDCGTLNVNEYWGAYLDYSPYTKLEIYLPYIGTKQISVDDVMNKACHVYYNIDILTGACCAMIKCDDSVLYSYAGQCATSIPITGSDWTNVVSGAISVALSVASYYAGAQTGPLTDASAIHTLSSSCQSVMQMKPTIEKTGSIAGSAGMLGVQSPYLILTRPRQALPNNQNHFTGYPSYVNVKLGDLTGMTFVEQVHLENIPCTSSEQSEIETLLKGGVIF